MGVQAGPLITTFELILLTGFEMIMLMRKMQEMQATIPIKDVFLPFTGQSTFQNVSNFLDT
jgi:hypothetical protein